LYTTQFEDSTGFIQIATGAHRLYTTLAQCRLKSPTIEFWPIAKDRVDPFGMNSGNPFRRPQQPGARGIQLASAVIFFLRINGGTAAHRTLRISICFHEFIDLQILAGAPN
jgi:hypothetical protein